MVEDFLLNLLSGDNTIKTRTESMSRQSLVKNLDSDSQKIPFVYQIRSPNQEMTRNARHDKFPYSEMNPF